MTVLRPPGRPGHGSRDRNKLSRLGFRQRVDSRFMARTLIHGGTGAVATKCFLCAPIKRRMGRVQTGRR